jgi:hypothetical protein
MQWLIGPSKWILLVMEDPIHRFLCRRQQQTIRNEGCQTTNQEEGKTKEETEGKRETEGKGETEGEEETEGEGETEGETGRLYGERRMEGWKCGWRVHEEG